jgi:hypothetical protein
LILGQLLSYCDVLEKYLRTSAPTATIWYTEFKTAHQPVVKLWHMLIHWNVKQTMVFAPHYTMLSYSGYLDAVSTAVP